MSSKKTVEEFVSSHNLRKADNTIIFDAQVSFYKGDVGHKLASTIHIITLPREMVVYIDEFFHEAYRQPEIYSTEIFYFSYKGAVLEIRGFESQPDFLLSIMVIK